jgi:hypothetical protein
MVKKKLTSQPKFRFFFNEQGEINASSGPTQ